MFTSYQSRDSHPTRKVNLDSLAAFWILKGEFFILSWLASDFFSPSSDYSSWHSALAKSVTTGMYSVGQGIQMWIGNRLGVSKLVIVAPQLISEGCWAWGCWMKTTWARIANWKTAQSGQHSPEPPWPPFSDCAHQLGWCTTWSQDGDIQMRNRFLPAVSCKLEVYTKRGGDGTSDPPLASYCLFYSVNCNTFIIPYIV